MSQLFRTTIADRWRANMLRAVGMLLLLLLEPFNIFSSPLATAAPAVPQVPVELPDSFPIPKPLLKPSEVVVDSIDVTKTGVKETPVDTIPVVDGVSMSTLPDSAIQASYKEAKGRTFTPDPTRAVWLSALCPGLGQIYNRRYWKLPIVVGAYMGLAYGTSWNNMMLQDYTRAYNDIMDSDPSTNSYMDFFPPTISESDLDKEWLTNICKARKDFYRRNRDLCIISMVGVYLIAMVDAYVDASLSQFDITPDLALKWSPAVIPDSRHSVPGFGLQWALCF